MTPKYLMALALPLLAATPYAAAGQDCATLRPQEVVACHIGNVSATPLDFTLVASESTPGLTRHRYRLTSQAWLPEAVVKPQRWQHPVDILVPDHVLPGAAVLVVNNSPGLHPANYPPQALARLARETRTVVVMIADVPDQPITFRDAPEPMLEDVAVAHTWATALRDPKAAPELPLHVPMAAAASRAMDLAQLTQPGLDLKQFIITGASKRGWSAWLTSLADERIMAIVPSVIDVADTSSMLTGLRQRYGGNWPAALLPYQRAGVLQQLGTPGFDRLMAMMDPMQYLPEAEARLSIPKYLVSASGDDFFAPDPVTDYQQRLPGETTRRVLPNSDHGGVVDAVQSTLIPAVRRLREGRPLPSVEWLASEVPGQASVTLSEQPVALKVWTASNEQDRDFRYACGVRYRSSTLKPSSAFTLAHHAPAVGWQAQFVEAVFADGFVATSAVSVLPQTYPQHPPTDHGGACKSFPSAREWTQ